MELFEINNLKKKLIQGELIELSNQDDLVQLFHRKSLDGSEQFFIELNCEIIAMNKRFRTFRGKVWGLVVEKNLEFS